MAKGKSPKKKNKSPKRDKTAASANGVTPRETRGEIDPRPIGKDDLNIHPAARTAEEEEERRKIEGDRRKLSPAAIEDQENDMREKIAAEMQRRQKEPAMGK